MMKALRVVNTARWYGFAAMMLLSFALTTHDAVAQSTNVKTRYVDASQGSDTSDGLSPGTAFKTIARGLADVPVVVDAHWVISLAPGEYREGAELRKFLMPAGLSNPQLKSEEVRRAISFLGQDPAGGAVLSPPSGVPCFSASDIILFLDSLGCRVGSGDGITAAGTTLVLDDISVEATGSAGNALYAEDSRIYLGGNIAARGPFAIGMSLRVNTFARAGTRKNPNNIALLVDGAQQMGIFLRDGGNLTAAFETGSIRVANSAQAIYAILASRVFIPAGITLNLENVGIVSGVTQQSFLNAHEVIVTGSMPSPFVRCHKDSYILLETVKAPTGRSADTDGTCSILVY